MSLHPALVLRRRLLSSRLQTPISRCDADLFAQGLQSERSLSRFLLWYADCRPEEQSRLGCNQRRAAQPTHKDRCNWIAHNVSNRDACFRKMDSTARTQDVCPCQRPYFEADRRLSPRRQASGISRLTASDENCNRAARVRQALVVSEASEIAMPIIGGDKSRVVAKAPACEGSRSKTTRRARIIMNLRPGV